MIETNRIYNMDCIEGLKLIEDNSVDFILTDPPYNIGDNNKMTKSGDKIVSTFEAFGEWDCYDEKEYLLFMEKTIIEYDRILKNTGSCIIFVDKFNITYFRDFGIKLGWHPVNFYCLIKNNPVPNFRKAGFTSGFELAIIFNKNKKEKIFNFLKQNEMQNYFKYNIGQKFTTHPTEKPIEAFKKLIKIYTNENNIVLDPFMGSGTTAVACKQLNRNFIGFEISKEYCDIANKRLQRIEKTKGYFK